MAWDRFKDRRKERRVDLRMLLEFDDSDGGENERLTRMETLNFSAGGFYCRLDREILPLTRLALRFVFPPFGPDHTEEYPIDCEAVIVRCDNDGEEEGLYRLAACFTDLATDDREYIRAYLDWYDLVFLQGNDQEWDGQAPDDDLEEGAA